MRLRNFYLLVILVAISLVAVWYVLKFGNREPVAEVPLLQPTVSEQLIEKEWISFSAPQSIVAPAFDIQMDVLKPIDRIDVLWKHPSSGQSELYSLKSFQAKTSEALYMVGVTLGNLLPGKNSYEVVGVMLSDGQPLQEFRVEFDVDFDLKKYVEIRPSFFIFYPYSSETDLSSVAVRGTLASGVQQLRVYSWNKSQGQASFTILNKYVPLEKKFEYFIDEKFENFSIGKNEYVIEALDETDTVVARKYFTVRSTKLTFEDKVKNLFGDFQLVKGGWYISSALPWFSVRPVYDSVWIPEEEGKVVLPRPTLMYSIESNSQTDLCDYLKSIDYKRENYSYQAYSYETCQKFRYGVSVYDRFLSVLEFQPFALVMRTDYKEVENTASSAFVMIETGGMKEESPSLLFGDEAFSDPSKDPASNPDMKEKKYYLYQMMITDEVAYEDKKIGDIALEISSEQQEKIDEVKAFLNTYSGDEIFSPFFFPEDDLNSEEELSQ